MLGAVTALDLVLSMLWMRMVVRHRVDSPECGECAAVLGMRWRGWRLAMTRRIKALCQSLARTTKTNTRQGDASEQHTEDHHNQRCAVRARG